LARRIPDELVEEIRSANDIVDVISERIPVKKAGRNYKAVCPFHQEKTPSFNINPERQIYHCFGCGAGGNVITFLMEYEKMGFLDAVRELAERAGIRLPDRTGPGEGDDDPIFRANAMALEYFRRSLRSERGSAARAYLEGRGLTEETVETFALGYAPAGWDGLLSEARERSFAPDALEEAGLAIRREGGGHYDRFRDRIIFPLLLSKTRVVGFGGRALGDQDPKYLNSPETRVYHKGRYLYGLWSARPVIRGSREAILVEGYMDVIALHEAGFTNTIASAGTALTPEQAKAISKYADKVFVAYDGDEAGLRAATRAAETLVALGLKVRIASFPGGKDPDSYVREAGAGALRERLEGALDFIDFMVRVSPSSTADERERVARRLIETVARVEDPLKADLMLEKIADALSIRRAAVARAHAARREEADSRGVRGAAPGRGRDDAPVIEDASTAAQKGILSLVLCGDSSTARILSEIAPADFDAPARGVAERLWEALGAGRPVDVAALLSEPAADAERRLLTELSVLADAAGDGERLCDDYIRTIERRRIELEIRSIDRAIETAEMTNSDEELLALAEERQGLARRLRDLAAGR
jgi:DNA primase